MENFDIAWPFAPEELSLLENEVHVWCASLEDPASKIQSLRTILSVEEAQRADRFRFPKDRNHFIVAHSVLRLLLSRYLNISTEEIRFQHNRYGKPALSPEINPKDLRFNLSHSGKMVLYGFTYQREIGIDVEWSHRRIDQFEQIAERFFSEYENQMLRRLPEQQKHVAFFNCWTRKEAYIKAKGRGLSLPLDQFDVSLRPGEPAKLLATRNDPEDVLRWKMLKLEPGSDYVAALLVEGDGWDMKCWQWIVSL